MTREAPDLIDAIYATRIRVAQGWLIEMAGMGSPDVPLARGERIEVSDSARGQSRVAILRDGQVQALLFVSRSGNLPARDWLVEQLVAPGQVSSLELLAGRPAAPRIDRGPIVCVCFDVGMKTILAAIRDKALTSVDAVGAALSAGTNCGSCRPAIHKLIVETKEAIRA